MFDYINIADIEILKDKIPIRVSILALLREYT